MEIPSTLQKKIDLYQGNGRIFRENNELFAEYSWLQVMHGQGIRPNSYSPLADRIPEAELIDFLEGVEEVIGKCVDRMPTHAEFIAEHCAADSMAK